MKKTVSIFIIASLVACNSSSEKDEKSAKGEVQVDTTAQELVEETIEEVVVQDFNSKYYGSWKVVAVDGQKVQIDQIFIFKDDGVIEQTINGNLVGAGKWNATENSIIWTKDSGNEDVLEIVSEDEGNITFMWKGKKCEIKKQ